GAARLWRQHGRTAQQNANLVTTLRQLLEQMAADEASAAGERDKRDPHVGAPTRRRVAKLGGMDEPRMYPSGIPSCTGRPCRETPANACNFRTLQLGIR